MNILIVEDDPITQEFLFSILTSFGECHRVRTGEDAYNKFILAHGALNPYDLITVDLNLPGMSGQETVSKIRRWEEVYHCANFSKTATVLIISVDSQPNAILGSFRRGCEGFLCKPFLASHVRATLEKLGFNPLRAA